MPISVCITSFNQVNYLAEAIDSALAQTLKPGEIIIVDDASTDSSPALIAGYAARYPDLVRPIFHSQNVGVARARNSAVSAVSGEYLTFLDGDDRFLATKLENELRLMEHIGSAYIVFSDVYTIAQDGRRIQVWAGNQNVPEGDAFLDVFTRRFPRRRLFRSELVPTNIMVRSGGYDPNLKVYEDYELRIRLAKMQRTAFNPQPESEHRRLPGGLSRAGAEILLDSFEYICQKNKPLIQDLLPQERQLILKFQDTWRAELLRRMALEHLSEEADWLVARKKALDLFRKSLDFSHTPGIKIWVQFFLPRDLLRAYRKKRGL